MQLTGNLIKPHCCADTGATTKLAFDLNSKSGAEYRKSEMSAALCLNEASDLVNLKGGFSNMKAESLFRECTGIDIVGSIDAL